VQSRTFSEGNRQLIQVVVASTVMLTFISAWRAASVVLNDMLSTLYYIGGIVETALGVTAPWWVLAVMCFSYVVRSVYFESCAMFTRGGVYRVVKEAMGGTLGKLSVAALLFDYVLTGPISSVSAGQYIMKLAHDLLLRYLGVSIDLTEKLNLWVTDISYGNLGAVILSLLVLAYFWYQNTKGIEESSDKAVKIMWFIIVMLGTLIIWVTLHLAVTPSARRLPPLPTPARLSFNDDAVGLMPKIAPREFRDETATHLDEQGETVTETRHPLAHPALPIMGAIGLLMAFGHSILAMSGEETLAQINRELRYPKHRNLVTTGNIMFMFCLVGTSLISFVAYAVIPDSVRLAYADNLVSGIVMNLVGPEPLRVVFNAYVVFVGFLILAGAQNTSIVGSRGVLERISEDGVLTDWFRRPHDGNDLVFRFFRIFRFWKSGRAHRGYGTPYRIINLMVVLQAITTVASRGDVYVLGEAYAFGVVWSFAFKALAVMMLRFIDRSPREWKVPFNIPFRNTEIPVGLGLITGVLFAVAGMNLITKLVATASGVMFTTAFFIVFVISEKMNERKRHGAVHEETDEFRTFGHPEISAQVLEVRPGCVLVPVRDLNNLAHLELALREVDTNQRDIVVMTAKSLVGPDTGYEDLDIETVFGPYEKRLFTRVVALAERQGKPVKPLVIPMGADIYDAIALVAAQLDATDIYAGGSAKMSPFEQERRMGEAWEKLPEKPGHPVSFSVVNGERRKVFLGEHSFDLSQETIHLAHELWLRVTHERGLEHIHHADIATVGLEMVSELFNSPQRDAIIARFQARTGQTTVVDERLTPQIRL
jgi:amino acid transporter